MKCQKCDIIFAEDCKFCENCGTKLSQQKTKVYANMGKNGITSLSYKLPDGTTLNSKGNITIPMGKGISYTTKKK